MAAAFRDRHVRHGCGMGEVRNDPMRKVTASEGMEVLVVGRESEWDVWYRCRADIACVAVKMLNASTRSGENDESSRRRRERGTTARAMRWQEAAGAAGGGGSSLRLKLATTLQVEDVRLLALAVFRVSTAEPSADYCQRHSPIRRLSKSSALTCRDTHHSSCFVRSVLLVSSLFVFASCKRGGCSDAASSCGAVDRLHVT